MSSAMSEEHHDIVIVGGGICGLATALALHRKGINSLVLEKSNELRAAGAAIGIWANAWHALNQLGVGTILRSKSITLSEIHDVWRPTDSTRVTPCREDEFRCFKRSDLVESLAESLPKGSLRLGCHVVAVDEDHETHLPTLYIDDGSIIRAKVLIGCDGANSVIANSLGLAPSKLLPNNVVRGLTNYPNGHNFSNIFLRISDETTVFGRIPISDNVVHWFIDWSSPSKENSQFCRDPMVLRDLVIDSIKDYPPELIEMVECSELASLSHTHIRFRAPWHLLFANLWKRTTTVAGDAMHVMGPFLGQGGGAALEDAVVLGRCLARPMEVDTGDPRLMLTRIEAALRAYTKERKLRVLRLSVQSYLVGLSMSPLMVGRLVSVALLMAFFGGYSLSHTQYDCGSLKD